jgi:hypothetical protein
VVTVPAFVWRGGLFRRALIIGFGVGLVFGALALLDSGIPLAALIVLVIMGVFYGVWMPRRMARYWPGAKHLTGDERVTVVRTARRGERIGDPKLAQAVIDYNHGLQRAAEKARPFRWVVWFVLVVAVGMAVGDTVLGSARDGVASCVYLALIGVELFWWPPRQDQLLSNADRASDIAAHVLEKTRN